MGIFDYIFGSKKRDASQLEREAGSNVEISFMDRVVSIDSLKFIGLFNKSKSGEWIICWSEHGEDNSAGSSQVQGLGNYVLYNAAEQKIVLHGEVERPTSCCVADNGNFCIEDGHLRGDLSGTLYVFSSTGDMLINKNFQANIFSSAISNNGLYAICQTANSPESEDGNRLTAFDIGNKVILFSIHPITGWTTKYKFNENIPKFGVVVRDVGTFYYDKQGELIKPKNYDLACLKSRDYAIALMKAEEIIKSTNIDDMLVKEVQETCVRVLSLSVGINDDWKALAYKIQGLANEHLHNYKEALAAYDKALVINPKIGVKRKADALRRKQGGNS